MKIFNHYKLQPNPNFSIFISIRDCLYEEIKLESDTARENPKDDINQKKDLKEEQQKFNIFMFKRHTFKLT